MPELADLATAGLHPSTIGSMRDQCSSCGAALASDQRYCVECGQRLGPPRVPLVDGHSPSIREASTARRSGRRAHMSPNSTLIAGIGTLLLAMGVGVLIGRSGNNVSTKSPPVQVVTVAGTGGSTGVASTSTETPSSSTGAAKATKSSGSSSTSSVKPASKAPATPLPKAVTVGSKGSGPGYEKGQFTGNFFGK